MKAIRLKKEPRKQNFVKVMKKVFEPVTDTTQITSENLTKTLMLISKKNNKALENLNNKLVEILIDRGVLACYLTSPLCKITIFDNKTQNKLVKDPNSIRVNFLLIK